LSAGLVKPGDKLLDIGCGPGLYAGRLAARGVKVTGIDISGRSLNYAIAQARKNGLEITYRHLSFLELDYTSEFDVAIQVYGEMGVFSDEKLAVILNKVYNALKPGGRFIFDVTTPFLKMLPAPLNNWYFARSGFWRPIPHLTMECRYDYPENDVFCNQYIVMDEEKIAVYRVWIHNYTPETITPALEKAGFSRPKFWNNLSGEPYKAGVEWLAVAAEKT
jgi:SAM-dependent methyltransferase